MGTELLISNMWLTWLLLPLVRWADPAGRWGCRGSSSQKSWSGSATWWCFCERWEIFWYHSKVDWVSRCRVTTLLKDQLHPTTSSHSTAIAQATTEMQHWPVYAWLGVYNLVQAGHFKTIGIPSLAFIQEVPKGQDHLQNLSQTFTPHHLTGCTHNSWGEEKKKKTFFWHPSLYTQLRVCGIIIHNNKQYEHY